jgi:hypothetical protein
MYLLPSSYRGSFFVGSIQAGACTVVGIGTRIAR